MQVSIAPNDSHVIPKRRLIPRVTSTVDEKVEFNLGRKMK